MPDFGSAVVILRDVREDDLPVFFEQQRDPDANFMAAFTAKDPNDRGAFDAHWQKILGDDAIEKQTIVVDGIVAGNISRFEMFGEPSICYWIGKEFWGRGVATAALSAFLAKSPERPLFARVAFDNHGSRRVLEKCGFAVTGQERGFANARGQEIDELVFTLT
jgi:RimJ/RimL family protein N-acetyltransferase